ncbi:MAG TPA: hypothetical protein VJZ52_01120 [Candidatus Paceibacterota bacterium]|nr:hypothetical protein [Candidatus Paceibacterota bacterium]
MSRLPIEIKEKAHSYRKRGYSIKELSRLLNIAKSTASLWSRDVSLTNEGKERLLTRIKLGQYNSAEKKKSHTAEVNKEIYKEAENVLGNISISPGFGKLLCAMIYWCEGSKDSNSVRFTNSDPKLIKRFLQLLKNGYGIKWRKVKVRLHLHSYHSQKKQTDFWAKELKIPTAQFYKPYLKTNTGKRIRNNYPGCAAIYYHDTILARKLMYLAKAYLGA